MHDAPLLPHPAVKLRNPAAPRACARNRKQAARARRRRRPPTTGHPKPPSPCHCVRAAGSGAACGEGRARGSAPPPPPSGTRARYEGGARTPLPSAPAEPPPQYGKRGTVTGEPMLPTRGASRCGAERGRDDRWSTEVRREGETRSKLNKPTKRQPTSATGAATRAAPSPSTDGQSPLPRTHNTA